MFGYVKPVPAELLVKEYEFYRATYCGICRAMKKHTGALSNVTLSYDSVFLALVRMLYIDNSELSASMRRCIAHPMKKKCMLNINTATEYTARAFAILTYYKLIDDLNDEKLTKRIAVNSIRPIIASAKKQAGNPELADFVAEKLNEITKLEQERCPSVDKPAGLFGELLGEIFCHGLTEDAAIVTRECGRALGRFIYAADAAEDYDKDRRSGSYNPYVIMYDGKELSEENKGFIKCALILECKKLERAVDLMPFEGKRTIENLIKNIVYLGLVKRIGFLDPEKKKDKDDPLTIEANKK